MGKSDKEELQIRKLVTNAIEQSWMRYKSLSQIISIVHISVGSIVDGYYIVVQD